MLVPDSAKCACEICKNEKDFDLPEQLLEAFRTGEVVIFAGAGVSTEGKSVLPYTFYEDVASELSVEAIGGPPFPELMTALCTKPNGRHRMLLKLKERFDYIKSFGELHRDATRFHRELSTIHQIEHIITTNWDDYFETECGATPYVSAEDFALWKFPGRKVFKIHGSINSLGSIIATTEDYERCYDALSRGLIGSQLKTMLATKTILYVGYSFSDFDFLKIHEILTAEMKGMRPHSYIVTLDDRAKGKFERLMMTPIITDGTHFLTRVKEHLVRDKELMSDEAFEGLSDIYYHVADVHREVVEIEIKQHPTVILTASYQDGLMHALERMNSQKHTGEYSCKNKFLNRLNGYEDIRKHKMRSKKFTDVAYIDGYVNGLLLLLATAGDRRLVPVFYAYGSEQHPKNMRQYRRYLKDAPIAHKTAYKWCERLIKNSPNLVPGIVFHHAPTLL